MQIFRICRDIHQTLDGEGARLCGGRWNSPGFPLVYTSEHISLCVLEQLVHLDPDLIPDNWVVVTIEIPDHLSSEELSKLPAKENATRKFGDRWLSEKRSLLLKVPSIVVTQECNVLLNPLHSEMKKVIIKGVTPFVFDPRFIERKDNRPVRGE